MIKMMTELLSTLIVDETNFKTMHWMFRGVDFDLYHKTVSVEYYELCSDLADEVAEMLIRLGGKPVGYAEALSVIDSSDHEFMVLSAGEYYDKEEFIANTNAMFTIAMNLIQGILLTDEMNDISVVGIKSSLEAIHDKLSVQRDYINARRG